MRGSSIGCFAGVRKYRRQDKDMEAYNRTGASAGPHSTVLFAIMHLPSKMHSTNALCGSIGSCLLASSFPFLECVLFRHPFICAGTVQYSLSAHPACLRLYCSTRQSNQHILLSGYPRHAQINTQHPSSH